MSAMKIGPLSTVEFSFKSGISNLEEGHLGTTGACTVNARGFKAKGRTSLKFFSCRLSEDRVVQSSGLFSTSLLDKHSD